MMLACAGNNVVVEHFFGNLKHDWILNVVQPTRDHIKQYIADYVRYYNNGRLHTVCDSVSSVRLDLNLTKR